MKHENSGMNTTITHLHNIIGLFSGEQNMCLTLCGIRSDDSNMIHYHQSPIMYQNDPNICKKCYDHQMKFFMDYSTKNILETLSKEIDGSISNIEDYL